MPSIGQGSPDDDLKKCAPKRSRNPPFLVEQRCQISTKDHRMDIFFKKMFSKRPTVPPTNGGEASTRRDFFFKNDRPFFIFFYFFFWLRGSLQTGGPRRRRLSRSPEPQPCGRVSFVFRIPIIVRLFFFV